VEDRVGDRGVRADVPQLADALDAQCVDVFVLSSSRIDVTSPTSALTGIR
jgi:hypothetical protein